MAYAKQKITKIKTKKITFNKKNQKRCPKCGKYMK